jgi:hypothetical protein
MARHFWVHWRTSQVATVPFGTAVEARTRRVQAESRAENEFCVPSVSLKGDSYRLKGKELGRVPSDNAS